MDFSNKNQMENAEMEQAQMEQAQMERAQKEIARLFENLKEEIPIYLFAQPGINDVFTDAARQAVRHAMRLYDKEFGKQKA